MILIFNWPDHIGEPIKDEIFLLQLKSLQLNSLYLLYRTKKSCLFVVDFVFQSLFLENIFLRCVVLIILHHHFVIIIKSDRRLSLLVKTRMNHLPSRTGDSVQVFDKIMRCYWSLLQRTRYLILYHSELSLFKIIRPMIEITLQFLWCFIHVLQKNHWLILHLIGILNLKL